MTPGYQALREGAAWLDLTGRGHIRVTGEDRARLLHAMTTNHIAQLKPAQWCYAFFLNAQGRMLADANILCLDDLLLIDVEPAGREFILKHLDQFIIADDVELTDLTDETAVIAVEGPTTEEVIQRAGVQGHALWNISSTGAPAQRFFVHASEAAALIVSLQEAGAVAATAEDAETVRLEHALPKFGVDLTGAHIPHEGRLAGAVHFNKGCYLGQEIVERVRSRGKPHRLLVHFEVAGSEPVAVGAKVVAPDGKEIGEITSSAYSPAEGKTLALGYIRTELSAAGSHAAVSDGASSREAVVTARLVDKPA